MTDVFVEELMKTMIAIVLVALAVMRADSVTLQRRERHLGTSVVPLSLSSMSPVETRVRQEEFHIIGAETVSGAIGTRFSPGERDELGLNDAGLLAHLEAAWAARMSWSEYFIDSGHGRLSHVVYESVVRADGAGRDVRVTLGSARQEVPRVYEESVVQICKKKLFKGTKCHERRDQRERGLTMEEMRHIKARLEDATEAVLVPALQKPMSGTGVRAIQGG